jgi:hypothetical protein
VKNRTKFVVGVALFTLAPALWMLSLGPGKSGWSSTLTAAAILGAVGGATFVMGYGLVILARNAKKAPPDVPLELGEHVAITLPANHLEGFVSHGGNLRLTNLRLIFLPHRFNFKLTPVIIPLQHVERIALGATAEFRVIKLAATAALSSVDGTTLTVHTLPSSEVLRVYHGGAESHFVVKPSKELLDALGRVSQQNQARAQLSAFSAHGARS